MQRLPELVPIPEYSVWMLREVSRKFAQNSGKIPTSSQNSGKIRLRHKIRTQNLDVRTKIWPLFIRISLLCRTSQSPLHSLMRNLFRKIDAQSSDMVSIKRRVEMFHNLPNELNDWLIRFASDSRNYELLRSFPTRC